MRDRDRRSIREFMDAEAKEFAIEKEAKEKPIREAEKKLKQVHRELYAVQKQQVETGTDPDLWVDPATIGYTIPVEEAEKFNVDECRKFVQTHPEYFNSERNNIAVVGYLVRNNVQIFSALTIEKAVQRLQEFRLLEEKPEPEPLPIEPVVTFDTPEQTKTQNYEVGIDPATGEECRYTLYEINKMSSDEYRRCFKVTKQQLNLGGRNW